VTRTRSAFLTLVLGAAASLALLAGCGSDESGEDTTAPQVSVPSVTSPLGTTTSTTATGTAKQKTTKTTSGTGGSAPCAIPDSFQNFKYTGLDCAAAVAVAQAWDSNGKACNTVDNPNVDAGYRRTCEVEGYSCTAKRDVHSDARFVTCTQGGLSIRFTWLPA
jgi:cytoskeletal protein RodZ